MSYLLHTKFYIPPAQSNLLPRLRLVAKLQEGLSNPLVVICAPAGFGKTTLLSEWRESVEGRDFPLAWLALEEEDNDPIRFLTYLIAALQTLREDIGLEALVSLQSAASPKTILTDLIGSLEGLAESYALVLEDYHTIHENSVHDLTAFLVSHLPLQMRLILSTRLTPPLSLSRLRVRGQLAEILSNDLCFSLEETTIFFNQVMGLNLSEEDVARLYERTEGWIAGLKLVALSLQGTNSSPSRFISEFTGSHHLVADYLIEEVLTGLPDEVRNFMLQTSSLGCLSGPLCDAATGRSDGQEMLEWLERANLFTVRQDDDRQWFRYHHLFADLLRNRLRQTDPRSETGYLRKAADWYLENEMPEWAIYMVLEAGDYRLATELIEQTASIIAAHGETDFLQRYLARLPEDVLRDHPDLRRLIPQPRASPLTDREREVLSLIANGASNREVAEALVVSLGTVKKHLNNIFHKLEAQNRSQAVARARESGYL